MGRVLRPFPGKEQPVILDHAGNCINHGRPDIDRDWELKPVSKGPSKKSAVPLSVTCKRCFAVYPYGTAVCECGYEFGTADNPRIPEAVDGQLSEIAPVKEDKRKKAWDELVTQCKTKGYKPGWAKFRFKQQFGHWPPFKWPADEHSLSQEEKCALWEKLKAEEASGKQKPLWARIQFAMRTHEPAPIDGPVQIVEM